MTPSQQRRAAHKAKFAAVGAELAQRKAEHRDVDHSFHKTGHQGDRAGWSRSIALEAGVSRGTTVEDRIWREAVLSRDGYKCVTCHSVDHLEADHVKPFALYPDLRFNVDNGQTLCHACHVKTETYGSKVHRLVAVQTN